jgi:acetylcholinesterase
MKFRDYWEGLRAVQSVLMGSSSFDDPPIARLAGYGAFRGTTISTYRFAKQPLPTPIDSWLGIDYATQPIGEGRFRPVDWPAPFSGTKNATTYGNRCIQADSYFHPQDEACLNFNVYRPKGVSMSHKLPVMLWIHEGGFMQGGPADDFDGAGFVASSKLPIVVVTFNYRINALGFLPSILFEEEGLLNLGLRDQRLMLEFLNKHISAFGGDPDLVTLAGLSAGSHSTAFHYFHNYGEYTGKPLFARAYLESGSVTARAFPEASYSLYQDHFEEFMNYLTCPLGNNTQALDCLRSADIDEIRTIGSKLINDGWYSIRWPFQPALGGPLLEKPGSVSGIEGIFFPLPIMTINCVDEGKAYTPGDLVTNDDFLSFMHNISEGLTRDDFHLLETLYPDPATHPASPYADSPNSTQYERVSAAWSDYGYLCPGQETAYRVSAAGVPVWKGRWATNDSFPPWQGIPHAADARYVWADPDTQYPEMGRMYHAYIASFVATGDPNAHRLPGSPEWPRYDPEGYGLDSQPGLQLFFRPNETMAEDDAIRREQCLFWREPSRMRRLHK